MSNIEHEESFAELFEKSMKEVTSFEPGQLIEAEIVSISGGCVFLQLSGKSECQIDAEEFIDKEGNITVKVGDTIQAYFHAKKGGELLFTTKIQGDKAGKEVLESAFQNAIPVEGVVEKEIKGGYEVSIGDTRAFCPYSQMDIKRVDDPKRFVGTKQTFRITEYKEHGKNLLVSRRVLLEEERNAQLDILKKSLKEGMNIKGTVSSLQDFGAFVKIGVVRALLPISEISRDRVTDINSVLKVGQEIEASIMKIDWRNERITLSMKALLSDPWDIVSENYTVGSKYSGTVARITNFGAFVTLEPGLDGLIHIADMPGQGRDAKPGEALKQGKSVQVTITAIDAARRRMSLKPASSFEAGEEFSSYLEPEDDTYNPFAELLKGRSKSKK